MACDLERPRFYGVNSGAIRRKTQWAKVWFPNPRLQGRLRPIECLLGSSYHRKQRQRYSSAWEGGAMAGENLGLEENRSLGYPHPISMGHTLVNTLLLFILENVVSVLYKTSRTFSSLKFSKGLFILRAWCNLKVLKRLCKEVKVFPLRGFG